MDDSGDRAGAAMERSCGDAVEDGSGAADRDAPGGVWDVVVVGAGASAAHAAACTGRRVLLLEKARLPRYKTCGGGIIGPSLDALPNGFQVPVRDRVHAVTFCLNGRLSRTRRSKRMLFALVDRPEFDAALVEAAREAGAVVRTGVAFSRIDQEGPETVAVVLCDGQTLSARAVVGADGSAGRTGVHVGVTLAQVDFGMEAEIPVPPAVAEGWAQRVLIDWGPVPGSYGWVFPKGHTLSVGVIAARGDGAATRRYLKEFIDRLGLAGFEPDVVSGHLTRCRSADSPLSRGRVVVCGDAAGLLEPWTREGISPRCVRGAWRESGRSASPTLGTRPSPDSAGLTTTSPSRPGLERRCASGTGCAGCVSAILGWCMSRWRVSVRRGTRSRSSLGGR